MPFVFLGMAAFAGAIWLMVHVIDPAKAGGLLVAASNSDGHCRQSYALDGSGTS
jgi:hypothetical protein